jgi:hypothetical protein
VPDRYERSIAVLALRSARARYGSYQPATCHVIDVGQPCGSLVRHRSEIGEPARPGNAACAIKHFGILELGPGGVHVPVCGGLPKTRDMPAAAIEGESRAGVSFSL